MAVDVAVEAGHASNRLLRDSVFRLVEPGRGKARDQQAQAFQLFRRDNAVEEFAEVGLVDFAALGNVAEVGPGRQEERRRELGEVRLGNVEIDVEALLLGVGGEPVLRKQLVADRLIGVRQRPEPEGEQAALADGGGAEGGQLLPALGPLRQPHDGAGRDRLAARHGRRLVGAGEVVAQGHVLAAALHHLGLVLRTHAVEIVEIADVVHRGVGGAAGAPVDGQVLRANLAGLEDGARPQRLPHRLVLRVGVVPVGVEGGGAFRRQAAGPRRRVRGRRRFGAAGGGPIAEGRANRDPQRDEGGRKQEETPIGEGHGISLVR